MERLVNELVVVAKTPLNACTLYRNPALGLKASKLARLTGAY
jgi:hypothetical protein